MGAYRGSIRWGPPFVVHRHTNFLKSTLAVASPTIETILPLETVLASVDPNAPLIVVDVDEVLAMFMRGFERFVGVRGMEMRITKFALFQNIFRIGEDEHIDMVVGRELFDDFFRTDVEEIDVAPGAVEALADLSSGASIVILTNAPDHSREPRARWLARSGFPYPMIVNSGLKGPAVAALAARTRGPTAFIDDLLPNLDSVATDAPAVRRFQMVADERLRPFAFSDPTRHARIDEWPTLRASLAQTLGLSRR